MAIEHCRFTTELHFNIFRSPWFIIRFLIALAIGSISTNPVLSASPGVSNICRTSANYAALKTGIPETILLAISLTETGRKRDGRFEPWPWTVNMEGKGVWFNSRKAAFDYATSNFNRGARSFDVGCFQINYKWHHQAFESIHQMFDPKTNAVYAAKYLLTLYTEKGNWEDAIGAYHSRTKKYADRYKKRFKNIHARISGTEKLPSSAKQNPVRLAAIQRENLYPLLHHHAENAPQSSGSIFSLQRTSKSSLISFASGPLTDG